MVQFVLWLESGDRRIFQLLNVRMRCLFLNHWMLRITHLGGAAFSIGLFMILFLLNLIENEMMIEGSVSLIVSHLLVQLLKKSFSRRRPYMKEKFVHTVDSPLQDCSFPSGHSTAVFSWSTTVSLAIPWLSPYLFMIAVLVGLSRIYLGHHYPLDVSVGALIGIFFASAVHYL